MRSGPDAPPPPVRYSAGQLCWGGLYFNFFWVGDYGFFGGYRLPAGNAADRSAMLETQRHKAEVHRKGRSEGWTVGTC